MCNKYSKAVKDKGREERVEVGAGTGCKVEWTPAPGKHSLAWLSECTEATSSQTFPLPTRGISPTLSLPVYVDLGALDLFLVKPRDPKRRQRREHEEVVSIRNIRFEGSWTCHIRR